MKINKEDFKKIYDMYIENEDRIRPIFSKYLLQDGFIYATNTNIIIRTKVENIDFIEELNAVSDDKKIPNFNKVMGLPSVKEDITHYITNIVDLEHRIYSIFGENPITRKKCEACDGEGNVEYNFYYDENFYYKHLICPICNGDGIISDYEVIRFSEKINISSNLLWIIKETMKIVGQETIKFSSNSHNQITMNVGEFEILTMNKECKK